LQNAQCGQVDFLQYLLAMFYNSNRGSAMFLSSFESFIVISHAKMLLAKHGTLATAKYLHKNNVCICVAKLLILGK